MTTEVRVPELPESVSDGVVVCWHCAGPVLLARLTAMLASHRVQTSSSEIPLSTYIDARTTPVRQSMQMPHKEKHLAWLLRRVVLLHLPTAGISRSRLHVMPWRDNPASRDHPGPHAVSSFLTTWPQPGPTAAPPPSPFTQQKSRPTSSAPTPPLPAGGAPSQAPRNQTLCLH